MVMVRGGAIFLPGRGINSRHFFKCRWQAVEVAACISSKTGEKVK